MCKVYHGKDANGNTVLDGGKMIQQIGISLCVWKPYTTTQYKCVQCSLQFGKDQYFCNDYSLGAIHNCHDLYHKKYHGEDVDDNNNNNDNNSQ